MENVHAERSAGWSVLCYVAVLVIATFLNSGMPGMDVKPSDAALAFDQHRFSLLLGAWLTFPAVAFFLWFLVGLRTYLIDSPASSTPSSLCKVVSATLPSRSSCLPRRIAFDVTTPRRSGSRRSDTSRRSGRRSRLSRSFSRTVQWRPAAPAPVLSARCPQRPG